MKKYFNLALLYAVLALVAGVYFRELSKAFGYTGATVLEAVHPHLFMLGTFMFLIVALFAARYELGQQKLFRPAVVLYNIGLVCTVALLVVRGTFQVMGTPLTHTVSAAISGIAGLGHTALGVGILMLIVALKRVVLQSSSK